MKKIFYFLICILLCVGIVGGAVVLFNAVDNGAYVTANGETTVKDKDDGVTNYWEIIENVTAVELVTPENETTLITGGMEMLEGANVYLGTDTELDPALRFTCLVDNALVEEVKADKNKTLAVMFAPLDYFETVNTESYTYTDWVTAFKNAEKDFTLKEFDDFGTYNDYTSYMRLTLSEVEFDNVNRRYVAIGVLIDESGDAPVYTYAAMPDGQTYRSNSRSLAYATGEALNANAKGETSISETNLTRLKSYMNMVVDQANGLSAPSNNGSMPTVTLSSTTATMGLSGTHTIGLTIEPYYIDIPVEFVSSNTSVAKVSEYGIISSVYYGSATVSVYAAGEVREIAVTVSSNVSYL